MNEALQFFKGITEDVEACVARARARCTWIVPKDRSMTRGAYRNARSYVRWMDRIMAPKLSKAFHDMALLGTSTYEIREEDFTRLPWAAPRA